MITIINVELRLKSGFVSQRFRLVSFGFVSQRFRLISFRNGFVWFRFAKYSKPLLPPCTESGMKEKNATYV